MLVEVKLYYYHDLDLISMFKTGALPFAKTAKEALRAYARKKAIWITGGPAVHGFKPRRYYRYYLNLDEEKDAEIIDVLKRIRDGYRNNFIKTVIRFYICAPIPEEYAEPDDMPFFTERESAIAGGRKTIKLCRKPHAGGKGKPRKDVGKKEKKLKIREEYGGPEVLASPPEEPAVGRQPASGRQDKAADGQNNDDLTSILADITGL